MTGGGRGETDRQEHRAQMPLELRGQGIDMVQIPPDLVVKWQAIDIADVIFSLIWRRRHVHTGGENRKSRGEPLAPSTAHRFTT